MHSQEKSSALCKNVQSCTRVSVSPASTKKRSSVNAKYSHVSESKSVCVIKIKVVDCFRLHEFSWLCFALCIVYVWLKCVIFCHLWNSESESDRDVRQMTMRHTVAFHFVRKCSCGRTLQPVNRCITHTHTYTVTSGSLQASMNLFTLAHSFKSKVRWTCTCQCECFASSSVKCAQFYSTPRSREKYVPRSQH